MSFLQPLILAALPLIALPILIHLINQWRYQTKPWGAMMFLLAANRMNRGFAKIRQWLILAMRTLAIAGLIFAIARPLASGFLGLTGGGRTDTTMVLVDRSPSMQQRGTGGISKLETAQAQLGQALEKLGSDHWVAIDSVAAEPQAFESVPALIDSNVFQPASSTADLSGMLAAALDYLQTNKPGPTEIWICSDLRASDWNADSGTWSVVREGFDNLPQSVRFHLLAYPTPASENVTLRVTDVRREETIVNGVAENALLLSMQLSRTGEADEGAQVEIPIQVEIEGVRTELRVEMTGNQAELRNEKILLPSNQERGWGKVSLPADENNGDNEYYFVFAEEPMRRIVVVSEDRSATRALELAAGISAAGDTNATVEVVAPNQLDSLVLDGAALLVWQTTLPDDRTRPAIENYVSAGGQVIFFPPTSMTAGAGVAQTQAYAGVRWDQWNSQERVMVESWRGDQDLLAATASGVGLPVGQLELKGFATLASETPLSKLATLSGGAPLLAKVPSEQGGVYFFTASADPQASTLAQSGIVLFVAIQRAIEQGQLALGNTTQRVAAFHKEPVDDWRQIIGPAEVLSTEYEVQRGVYESQDRLFAVNRAAAEDQRDQLDDDQLETLFAGLPFSRVDDAAGNLSGIVREVWRLFLIAMIVALLVEAVLCIPRAAPVHSQASVGIGGGSR